MYFLYLLWLNCIFGAYFPVSESVIRNIKYPNCVNCRHFIAYTNQFTLYPTHETNRYGRCKQFGEINVVTGQVNYDLACVCRDNAKKCGLEGQSYEEKPAS